MSESIVDILSQGRESAGQASKIYGLVVGIVTNNKDPEKLGRVKVKFPWLDDTVESWWARLAYPMGGKERGFWWIPEVDDEVLVGFEHGDVRFPYVVGGLYNGVDKPPKAHDVTGGFGGTEYDHGAYSCSGRDFNEDGKNDLRFIRSRSGHLLIFDDKDGKEKITLTDKTGAHRIEIFTDKKKVVVTSSDGDIELIADKKIIMRCEDMEVHTRKNCTQKIDGNWDNTVKQAFSVDVTQGTTIKTKSGTKIEDQSTIDIKATAGATLKGMTVTAEAQSQMTAKGAISEFSASGITTVKGSLVKIN